jgi:hypothetical protein
MIFTQLLYFLIVSLIVVFFNTEIGSFLRMLAGLQGALINIISVFLPIASNANMVISTSIALTIIPFVVTIIPMLIYWLSKQKFMPGFYRFAWFIWFLSILVFILQR